MSSLIKVLNLSQSLLRNNAVALTTVRHHWNKDYKPGPYPVTREQRIKAAEKYGLHPSEYEPCLDDGLGHGDYPKMPDISVETKDPYYPYDYPELKRNYNEIFHTEYDLIREDRYNMNPKLRYPMWMLYAQFIGTMGGLYFIYWLFDHIKFFHSVMPKQYPKNGEKHYTFEQN